VVPLAAPQTRRPFSTVMARWTAQAAMGDLPGTNHDFFLCGQLGVGSPPDTAHTSTWRTPAGGVSSSGGRCGSAATMESMISKNSGAAAVTPTNAGLPSPSKLPTHTASAYGP